MKFYTPDGDYNMTFDAALSIYWQVQHIMDTEDVKDYLSGYTYEGKMPIVVEHNGKEVELNDEDIDRIADKYRDYVNNVDYSDLRYDMANDAMDYVLWQTDMTTSVSEEMTENEHTE